MKQNAIKTLQYLIWDTYLGSGIAGFIAHEVSGSKR